MIRHLSHKEIDKKKWDAAVASSHNSLIYAYSWYLDIVCEGWEALIKEDHEYIMPLTAGRKYGINYLYPPFFTQQLGIFSDKEIGDTITEEFLAAIPEKFKYIEINLNTRNFYTGKNFQKKNNLDHELSLDDTYEVLHGNYSENTQRNIKKADKKELELVKDVSITEVIRLFRGNRGKEVAALKDKDYARLKTLIESASASQKAKIWGVLSKGNLLAGAAFLISDARAIFIFSGLNEEGKKAGAMFFLIDSFIREYAGQKMIFDFEGSNNSELARFYKSFGSKECVYLQVRKNRLPALLKWMKK